MSSNVFFSVAVGYGKSEDDSKMHENIPKIIETPIYTNQQCFQSNRYQATISSGRTFCRGFGTGVGVYRGDSGDDVFGECDVDNYSEKEIPTKI